MKRLFSWCAAGIIGLVIVGEGVLPLAIGQDEPGVSIGAFYERTQDHKVNDEIRTFDYYGIRLQWRDARWGSVYADLGLTDAEWDDYEMKGAGLFGLGGYFWAWRAEDLAVPVDIGLHGAVYAGNLEWEKSGSSASSQKDSYLRLLGQAVLRADVGKGIRPMVRAGIIRFSGEAPDGGNDAEWEKTRPAVGVGLEVAPHPNFSAVAEGNYMAGPGFSVRLEIWF